MLLLALLPASDQTVGPADDFLQEHQILSLVGISSMHVAGSCWFVGLGVWQRRQLVHSLKHAILSLMLTRNTAMRAVCIVESIREYIENEKLFL